MFMETFDERNYIDFLYHSPDSETKFDPRNLVTIYRNKYERLSKKELSWDPKSLNSIILILTNIFSILKNDKFINLVNEKRIESYLYYLSAEKYDRVIYNQYVSVSLIEAYIEDDSIWLSLMNKIKSYLPDMSLNDLHDDSKDSWRILTYDIPILDYKYTENIPDIQDYNIDSILSFKDINTNVPVIDESIKNIFTSELKSYVNLDKIVEGGLFEHIFKQIAMMDLKKFTLSNISDIMKEILSNMSEDNINLIVFLQFKIIIRLFKDTTYIGSDFEDAIFIRSLMYAISLDIGIYNFTIKQSLDTKEKVYLAYNYHIIKIQDILDSIDNSLSGKKISLLLYKNQLCKSRNKLQERMAING